jgi:hypothetical protein
MSGSSPQPTTAVNQSNTQNQVRAPWGPSEQYLQQIGGMGTDAYQRALGMGAYSGERYAPLNATQYQGLAGIESLAGSELGGSQNLLNARKFTNDIIQSQGITPGIQRSLDQYGDLYNTAKDQNNPYLEQILAKINSGVDAQMSGAGRYGSGKHQEAIAAGEAPALFADYARAQQQMMQATGAEAGLYNQGIGFAGQAAQLTPTLDEARYMPAQHLLQAGQIEQANQQAQDAAAQQYWNESRDLPLGLTQSYANFIYPGAGLGGSTVQTGTSTAQNYQSPAPAANRALGGGLVGAGIGSSFGPMGAGLGGAAGAGLGYLL